MSVSEWSLEAVGGASCWGAEAAGAAKTQFRRDRVSNKWISVTSAGS